MPPKKSRKLIFTLLTASLIIGGFFVFAPTAHALIPQALAGLGVGAVKFVAHIEYINFTLLIIFTIVSTILSFIIWLGASLAEFMISIASFTTAPVVQTGWEITRGLCNMGFALILLLMSFATVLQIESFGLKKMLPRLVIAALLINFSLVFAGIFIDFAQLLTDYFVVAAKGGATGHLSDNLMVSIGLQNIFNFGKDASIFTQGVQALTGKMAIEQFFNCIMLLVAAFSFLALSFFLIIRVVFIWLFLILSPLAVLAWAAPSLPGGVGGGWEKWVSGFFKWVFFAPIYAFFLYLAILIGQSAIQDTLPGLASTWTLSESPLKSSFFETPGIIIKYIITVTILLGGLQFAQKGGYTGAKLVMNAGKALTHGGSRWLAKGAKVPGSEWLSKKIGSQRLYDAGWKKTADVFKQAAAVKQRVASMASPTVLKHWWAERQSRLDNAAFGPAKLAASAKGWSKPLTEYNAIAFNKKVAEEQSKTNAMTQEQRLEAFYDKKSSPEMKEAAWRSLSANNELDKVMAHAFQQALGPLGEQLKDLASQRVVIENNRSLHPEKSAEYDSQLSELNTTVKQLLTKQENQKIIGEVKGKYAMNPENLRNFMVEKFGEEKAKTLGNDTQMMLSQNGNFAFANMYSKDATSGLLMANDRQKMAELNAKKVMDLNAKDFWNKVRSETFVQKGYTVGDDGLTKYEAVDLATGAAEIIKNLTNDQLDQFINKQNVSQALVKSLDQKEIREKITTLGPNGERLLRAIDEKIGRGTAKTAEQTINTDTSQSAFEAAKKQAPPGSFG